MPSKKKTQSYFRESGIFKTEMDGWRRGRAEAGAVVLVIAVACFVTETWREQGRVEGKGTLLEETPAYLALRHRENLEIRAAEARLKAKVADEDRRQENVMLPQSDEQANRRVQTLENLAKKFVPYAKEKRTWDSRVHATQQRINKFQHTALVMPREPAPVERNTVSSVANRQDVKPVVVQYVEASEPAAVLRNDAGERDLVEVANQERNMMQKAESDGSALKQEENHDAREVRRMQQQPLEEETMAQLNKALMKDASLKSDLAAKDKMLAQMRAKLDRVEQLLHTSDERVVTHAHVTNKPLAVDISMKQMASMAEHETETAVAHGMHHQRPHKLLTQEFNNMAGAEKKVDDDMYHVMLAKNIVDGGTWNGARRHELRGESPTAPQKQAMALAPAPAPAPAAETVQAAVTANGGDTASVRREINPLTVIDKAIHNEEGGKRAMKPAQQVLTEAIEDGSKASLAATKARLEKEMAVIERSEDAALLHIRSKVSALEPGGAWKKRLLIAARQASPDDTIPTDDHDRDAVDQTAHARARAFEARTTQAATQVLAMGAHPHVQTPRLRTVKHVAKQDQRPQSRGALSDQDLDAVAEAEHWKPQPRAVKAAQSQADAKHENVSGRNGLKAIKPDHVRVAVAKSPSASAKGESKMASSMLSAQVHQGSKSEAQKSDLATGGSGHKGGVMDPSAEIRMAIKAEHVMNKVGGGATGKNPAAATWQVAVKQPARVAAPAGNGAACVTRECEDGESESRDEINPLSVIDKAMHKEELAHAAQLAAQEHTRRRQAQAQREARATRRANERRDLDGRSRVNADEHALATASKAAHKTTGVRPAAPPRPEIDPLAIIDQAMMKEKMSPKRIVGVGVATKSSGKAKPGSLLDLFGSKVAKSVGSLMDKVHRSEGRSTAKSGDGGKIADLAGRKDLVAVKKGNENKLRMNEVGRLAKAISAGHFSGFSATSKVDKARVEKEVDTGAMPPPQSPPAKTAASVRLTYGQKQENKDKQAELDLETMYKEGLLVDSKAAPGTIAQQEAVGGQHLPAKGAPRKPVSADEMAMQDLKRLAKSGLLKSKAPVEAGGGVVAANSEFDEMKSMGHNRLLQLFGKSVGSTYEHEQGLFGSKTARERVEDRSIESAIEAHPNMSPAQVLASARQWGHTR